MLSNQRRFGTVISGNRQRNQEISPVSRAAIISAVVAGQKKSAVARQFQLPRSTIQSLIDRYNSTQSVYSQPRSGRPKVVTPRGIRSIVRTVKQDFRGTRKQLELQLPLEVSPTTLRRTLNYEGIRKWLSKKKPFITPEAAKLRLSFARHWIKNEEELMAVRTFEFYRFVRGLTTILRQCFQMSLQSRILAQILELGYGDIPGKL